MNTIYLWGVDLVRKMLGLLICIIVVALISCSSDLPKQETNSKIVTIDPPKPSLIVEARKAKKELRLKKRRELIKKYCSYEDDDEDSRKRALRNPLGCVPLGFQIVTDEHPKELISLGMGEREVEKILSENGFIFLISRYSSVIFNGPKCGDGGINTVTYIREEKMNGADVFRVFYSQDGEVQVGEKCLHGLMSQNSFYLYEHEGVSKKRVIIDKFHLTVDETPESIQEKFYSQGWTKSRDSKPRCWGDMMKTINNGKEFFPIDFEKNEFQKPTVKLRVRAKFLLDCEDKKNPKVIGFDDLEVRL